MTVTLIEQARREAGLTQVELAELAGTSHPTLSAYERGRKVPRLDTVERVLAKTGYQLTIVPTREYTWHKLGRGRPFAVPSALPRLPIDRAFATVMLPLSVDWSEPRKQYDLRDRTDRALLYETVLRQGHPEDIETYVEGALLVDIWDELFLPAPIKAKWQPLISAAKFGLRGFHGTPNG